MRPVFLKTGNQSLYKDRHVERESRYKLFGRRDFLDVLRQYPGDHPIVTDFRERLRRLETAFTGYRHWTRTDDRREWSWSAWEGFFRCLEDCLDADWEYVPNPRGGFLGFWWHWVNTKAGDWLYLQLEIKPEDPEKQKLCFKVERGDDGGREARDNYHQAILAAGDGKVIRPARMRVGRTMTVGVWEGDWLVFNAAARLDMHRTVDNLRKAERIVEAAGTSA